MFFLEKVMVGNRRYWGWLLFLVSMVAAGAACYVWQLQYGLGLTGLSRDVSWGLYIGQFTFFAGVAASAVVVVLPYYLHDLKAFGKLAILSEFLAIAAALMCLLFVFVDLGQPARVLNVLRYPSPRSLMFWDMIALNGYVLLNAIMAAVTLRSEQSGLRPPRWIVPVIVVSIPWAIAIRIVGALLYGGLPGRSFWLTAMLIPRFLASAFAAGPALLILLCLVLRKVASFDVGHEARQKLALVVIYALSLNVLFIAVELFTAFYSGLPEHLEHCRYVWLGVEGHTGLAHLMWLSLGLAAAGLVLLLVPRLRANEKILAVGCAAVFASLWIEKGFGFIVGGFVPSPLQQVTTYTPTWQEWTIVFGIWAFGSLLLTLFYKITVSVREVKPFSAASTAAWGPSMSK
jgi:molybdopterin-containing oxidoreductase family membrane subunit